MMKVLILLATFGAFFQAARADIVQYGETLYVVNPTNGHASEIEPAPEGSVMAAVASNIVKITSGHYSYLFSVNPETGSRTRIDLDRNAPEAGMVKVIK
jgi:hypothetical protein